MPTYDYRCLKCKKTFEQVQKMSDQKLKSCPKCKGKVERLIGAGAGLIFKGTGFYITDYKKSSPPPSTKEGASSSEKKDSPKEAPKDVAKNTSKDSPKEVSPKKKDSPSK